MDSLRRALGLAEPQETRFFLFMAIWGIGAAIVYWFVSYEVAGTVLLAGLGLASAVIVARLVQLHHAAVVRERVGDTDLGGARPDGSGGGAGGIDRPFLDERGIIPDPSLGPFAVGLGAALMTTGLVFGIAPVVVGIVPFVWGALVWLRSARDELWTTVAVEATTADEPPNGAGSPGSQPGPAALESPRPPVTSMPGVTEASRVETLTARLVDRGEHDVVIVGGGFGGLYCARALHDRGIRATLVDARNFHLFQPLLYQVATGALSPGEIASSLRGVFERRRHITVLLGEVVAIRPDRRCVELADGGTLGYETLVLATGSETSYYGHDATWAPLAPGLKTIEDAEEIRRRVLGAFELAEREVDADARRRFLTFVIVGGGPTGVELAGAIGEIANVSFRRRFRRIDPTEARVVLVHADPRILGEYPERLSRKAALDLARLGVEVQTSTRVVDVGADGVTLEGSEGGGRIPAATVLWAAGVRASPLGRQLAEATGAETDRGGRLLVQADLTLPGHPEIFVIGDLANVPDPATGRPLPGVAPVAMQAGAHVAAAIRDRLDGRPVQAFRYRDKGALATIGTGKAVAKIGRLTFDGRLAWLLWLFVHIMYLVEYQNRVVVFIQWAWSFVTRGRSALLITGRALRPTGPPGRRA
jgi:NADH dehydrogenase